MRPCRRKARIISASAESTNIGVIKPDMLLVTAE